jgi:FMN phosphatase YigB (HAD superfamily)
VRIGFDMDGVLADFGGAFRAVEKRLFAEPLEGPAGQPENEAAGTPGGGSSGTAGAPGNAYEDHRRREAIWSAIRSTPDFWTLLQPLEPDAVRRIHASMLRYRWEVFFITQRPATDGDTVQRQTQRWLVAQGFDLPSVLVIAGSRGAAAAALKLDYHVDDNARNCLDVMSDAGAKTILIAASSDQTLRNARKMRMATVPSIGAGLDLLDQVSEAQSNPTLLERLATLVGWS